MKWKPVVGYESKYQVSDCGLVRRIKGQVVGQWKNSAGYLMVRLSSPRAMDRVHRIVASAFIPNPNRFPHINHLDFNRTNNHVKNLEWCSPKYNVQYSRSAGRMPPCQWAGRRGWNAKISDLQADQIRVEYKPRTMSMSMLALRFGISKKSVWRIVRNQSYKPLPEPPEVTNEVQTCVLPFHRDRKAVVTLPMGLTPKESKRL